MCAMWNSVDMCVCAMVPHFGCGYKRDDECVHEFNNNNAYFLLLQWWLGIRRRVST